MSKFSLFKGLQPGSGICAYIVQVTQKLRWEGLPRPGVPDQSMQYSKTSLKNKTLEPWWSCHEMATAYRKTEQPLFLPESCSWLWSVSVSAERSHSPAADLTCIDEAQELSSRWPEPQQLDCSLATLHNHCPLPRVIYNEVSRSSALIFHVIYCQGSLNVGKKNQYEATHKTEASSMGH